MLTVSVLRINAYAKLNLILDVLRKREDGYHDVRMIMQQIDLHDVIYLKKIPSGIVLKSDNVDMPMDDSNLAYIAAQQFFEKSNISNKSEMSGVEIVIKKNIPMEAGLGGGSADVAAVLKGLNYLFALVGSPCSDDKDEVIEYDGLSNEQKTINKCLSDEKLYEIGKKIGADVPFCIMGKTALSEGIGEILTPIKCNVPLYYLLVKPNFGISTKLAYQNIDVNNIEHRPRTDEMIQKISRGDIKNVAVLLRNVMEDGIVKSYPKIMFIKNKLMKYNALGSLMSGSGSTVFGVFDTKEDMDDAYQKMILDDVFLSNEFQLIRAMTKLYE